MILLSQARLLMMQLAITGMATFGPPFLLCAMLKIILQGLPEGSRSALSFLFPVLR